MWFYSFTGWEWSLSIFSVILNLGRHEIWIITFSYEEFMTKLTQ